MWAVLLLGPSSSTNPGGTTRGARGWPRLRPLALGLALAGWTANGSYLAAQQVPLPPQPTVTPVPENGTAPPRVAPPAEATLMPPAAPAPATTTPPFHPTPDPALNPTPPTGPVVAGPVSLAPRAASGCPRGNPVPPSGPGPIGAAAPFCIHGVDAAAGCGCGESPWSAWGPVPWQAFGPGEYTGHSRYEHVPEYRLRVDDLLELVYRLTREETVHPYQLNVGDEVRLESVADPGLDRSLIVQPDGSVTLKLLGQIRATRRTVTELRDEIERQYTKFYREPAITVTPIKVNTKLDDLRQSVNSQFGLGGQQRQARVTPEGTIALPAIGSIYVQGLTLNELECELRERYAQEVEGIEVTPVLVTRAPRFVFVLGEVRQGGRFTLEGPTTVMQALALGGGWTVGANLRQVVVFRRGDDWRLLATMLDLRGALYGKRPGPADEIWLNDADIVLVPKGPIKVANEAIEQVFTRGMYAVFPFSTSYSFNNFGRAQ